MGRSLGLTSGGQRREPCCCVKEMGERREGEGPFVKDLSLISLTHPSHALYIGTGAPICPPQVKPSDLPNFEPLNVVPYYITYIVPKV